jgi:hypothetical protein
MMNVGATEAGCRLAETILYPNMIFTDRAGCEEWGSGPPNYTILQTLHYGYHLCYSNLRPQLSSPLFTHVYLFVYVFP